jgi:hypothetical protein
MIFQRLNGFRKRPKPIIRRSVRLGLEALETRDCPSPIITSFSATPTNAPDTHNVELKGTVSDVNPSSVVIQFTQSVTGTAAVNSSGVFDVILSANCLGQVTAVGTGTDGSSAAAYATLASTAPVLTSFTVIQGPAGSWTFEGHVNVPEPVGTVVTFSGCAQVAGRVASVDANGNFCVTYILGPLYGGVSAKATDVWGQISNTIYDPIPSSPPLTL